MMMRTPIEEMRRQTTKRVTHKAGGGGGVSFTDHNAPLESAGPAHPHAFPPLQAGPIRVAPSRTRAGVQPRRRATEAARVLRHSPRGARVQPHVRTQCTREAMLLACGVRQRRLSLVTARGIPHTPAAHARTHTKAAAAAGPSAITLHENGWMLRCCAAVTVDRGHD